MNKYREEFEVIARSNGWNLTTYPEITGRIDYVNNFTEQAWQMYKHQQAKVEELQKRVDAVVIEIESLYLSGDIGFDAVKKLEQALKGGG